MDLYLNCLCNDFNLTNSFYSSDLTQFSVCLFVSLCVSVAINAFPAYNLKSKQFIA